MKKKNVSIEFFGNKQQQAKPYGFFIKCEKDVTTPYDKKMKTEPCFVYLGTDKYGNFDEVREIDPISIGEDKYIDTQETLVFRPHIKSINANETKFSSTGDLCRAYTDDVNSLEREYHDTYDIFQHTADELSQELKATPSNHISMKVNDLKIQDRMPDIKENRRIYVLIPLRDEKDEIITDMNGEARNRLVCLNVNVRTGTIFDIHTVQDDESTPYPLVYHYADKELRIYRNKNGQEYFFQPYGEENIPENITKIIKCNEQFSGSGLPARFDIRNDTYAPDGTYGKNRDNDDNAQKHINNDIIIENETQQKKDNCVIY